MSRYWYIIVLALAGLLSVVAGIGPEMGICKGSPLWTLLTWMPAHGNIWHLAVNIAVLVQIERHPSYRCWLTEAFGMTALAGVAMRHMLTAPMVGLSGVIYTCVGMASPWVRPTWRNIAIYAWMLAAGFLLPGVAGWPHLICFLTGMLYGLGFRYRDKNINRG